MVKNPTYLSLSEAAEATRKSKSVIHKALNNGTMSHVGKDESGYKIDPAELFRVFPKNGEKNPLKERSRTPENALENVYKIKELEVRLEAESQQKDFYKDQFRKVEQERDDWKKQAQTLLLQAPAFNAPRKPVEADENFSGSPTQEKQKRAFSGQNFAVSAIILTVGVMALGVWYLWPNIENRLTARIADAQTESLGTISPAAGQGSSTPEPHNFPPAPTGEISYPPSGQ